MSTVRDYLRWTITSFKHADIYFGHGTDNAIDEAFALLQHILGFPLENDDVFLEARLTTQEKCDIQAMVGRRIDERVPLPYLTGQAQFAGLNFRVDPRVLIPRSPIAELIEQGFSPWLQVSNVTAVLDLCTGGGCIGIACAHYFEDAQIDLADLSEEALSVAEDNIRQYDLTHRVSAVQSDLFSHLQGKTYQLIVSNPPYVDSEDLAAMPAEFSHEPSMALGSGEDGLDITRNILANAADYLTDDGILVVEVGNSGMALEHAYPDVPFTWVEFEHGGHGVFVFSRHELLQYHSQFALT